MSNAPGIHPSAFVDPAAKLGAGVSVGAFAVIEAGVVVGEGSSIGHHAVLQTGSTLGKNNTIHPHAVIGGEPQDLKYKGQPSQIILGDGNLVREFCTLNRGTEEGGGVTRIGHRNLFMAYVHVAHDCQVGNDIVIANSVALAGHCEVGDHATIGGLTGLHQRARVGTQAMVGALSRLSKDVPPYSITSGCDEVKVYSLNKLGLKRRGFSKEAIGALEAAYRIFQDVELNQGAALAALEALSEKTAEVAHLIEFVKGSDRGIYR
jgi:UDP-N-acetylglucosamine acyltransferase